MPKVTVDGAARPIQGLIRHFRRELEHRMAKRHADLQEMAE